MFRDFFGEYPKSRCQTYQEVRAFRRVLTERKVFRLSKLSNPISVAATGGHWPVRTTFISLAVPTCVFPLQSSRDCCCGKRSFEGNIQSVYVLLMWEFSWLKMREWKERTRGRLDRLLGFLEHVSFQSIERTDRSLYQARIELAILLFYLFFFAPHHLYHSYRHVDELRRMSLTYLHGPLHVSGDVENMALSRIQLCNVFFFHRSLTIARFFYIRSIVNLEHRIAKNR